MYGEDYTECVSPCIVLHYTRCVSLVKKTEKIDASIDASIDANIDAEKKIELTEFELNVKMFVVESEDSTKEFFMKEYEEFNLGNGVFAVVEFGAVYVYRTERDKVVRPLARGLTYDLGEAYYCLAENSWTYVGTDANSRGPYGSSTGWFEDPDWAEPFYRLGKEFTMDSLPSRLRESLASALARAEAKDFSGVYWYTLA